VEEGVLSVYKQSENGMTQAQVETIGPGDSFGFFFCGNFFCIDSFVFFVVRRYEALWRKAL